MPTSLDTLRNTVRMLSPTGPTGFEGLIAAVLTDLTKRTFALANSGAQQGKDGLSAMEGVIAFEGKLYKDALPGNEVLAKIAQLAGVQDSQVELWVLGSTGPVSSQLIQSATSTAKRLGIAVLVLDWPSTGLSSLATLLAMAPETSTTFLSANTEIAYDEVLAQLHHVGTHDQFADRSEELRLALKQPSIAPAYALEDNIAWLNAAFSSKQRARAEFAQFLCPQDPTFTDVLDRTALRDRLAKTIFEKPDGRVTAILGADGNGKSWAFAQAWAAYPSQPLTIVVIPDDIPTAISSESLTTLLIRKLMTQTNERLSDEAHARWRLHFARWRQLADAEHPRLVVFVDGLNQRDTVDWRRVIDAMSELVAAIGGKLVFSCRQLFYRDYLKGGLVSRIIECPVPEWTSDELDTLLQAHGSSIANLDATVVRSMRNPRLFGVAAALLKDRTIEAFGELSVNRLLFEHIRTGAAIGDASLSPTQFVAKIRTHAEDVIARLKQRQEGDVATFDITRIPAAERFHITLAARFFEVLPEDANKYVLKDEGLSLALGLSLVSSAWNAHRTGRKIDDALAHILDPIAALDRTSDVLIGAVLSAILQEAPGVVITALVRAFVGLQNIDSGHFQEFRALLRGNPSEFLAALEIVTLESPLVANRSWLTRALEESRDVPAIAEALDAAIHRWLSMYSAAAERMVSTPNTPEHQEKYQQELVVRAQELAEQEVHFNQAERSVFNALIRQDEGEYSRLSLLAFQFLAGRALAPHAVGLRNWCMATAFNGGPFASSADFDQLLQFNLVDWMAMRRALLDAAEELRMTGPSTTGKQALIRLLHATGNGDDAREAEGLIEELTEGQEPGTRWRRIEGYCATDPCDPGAERPDNIDATAQLYVEIDVSSLRKMSGFGQGDFLFNDALTGLARFQPDAAIATLQQLANEALTRPRADFLTATHFLENHSCALGASMAAPYVVKAAAIAQEVLDAGEDPDHEGWLGAQHALMVAFPHMSGDEQFHALLAHPHDETFNRDLCDLFMPCNPALLDEAMEQALASGDSVKQFRALAFATYSSTSLTSRFTQLATRCLSASHRHVRLSALGLIGATADADLLLALASSTWSADRCDVVKGRAEITNGSTALVMAALRSMLSIEACLERIDVSAYALLVERLGSEAANLVAKRLDVALRKAAAFHVDSHLPYLERHIDDDRWPSFLEASNKLRAGATPRAFVQEGHAGDAWRKRQQQNKDAAEQFERLVGQARASLISHFISHRLVAAIDAVDPAHVDEWVRFMLSLDQDALNNVHNMALVVAQAISARDPASGVALFERLALGAPVVSITLGPNHLPLDAAAAWSAPTSTGIKALLFARLDRCRNDRDLATEVLAALSSGRDDVLGRYVRVRRQCAEPAHQARAVMVAGLSPACSWSLETIDQFESTHGFLQEAYTAATEAMDRHRWSTHWSDQMRRTTDPKDLWRYSVLLSKIVDGRSDIASLTGTDCSPLLRRFAPTFYSAIERRMMRWKGHRKAKLFGMATPDTNLLPG